MYELPGRDAAQPSLVPGRWQASQPTANPWMVRSGVGVSVWVCLLLFLAARVGWMDWMDGWMEAD